jgi:methyl-CpG-binding domain protein 4
MLVERVAQDPWKLLVAVTLLNKTTAKVALPMFWHLMDNWPSPWAMGQGKLCLRLQYLYLTLHNI